MSRFKILRILRFDQAFLLCLTLLVFPFQKSDLQFEVSVVTLNLFSTMVLFTAMLTILRMLINSVKYEFNTQDVTIFMLCLVYMASTILSDNVIDAGYIAFKALFIPVLSYFACKALVTNRDQHERILISFILGAVIFAGFGIATYLVDFKRLSVLGIPAIGTAAISISAMFIFIAYGFKHNIITILFIAMIIATFTLAFSRIFIVILICSPFIYSYIRKGAAFQMLALLMASGLLFTMVLVASSDEVKPEAFEKEMESSSKRVTSIEAYKKSLYGRSLYYRDGIEQFSKSPIIGNGFGRDNKVRHSAHIEWLEYGGIIGYVLHLFVFLGHFSRMRKIARVDSGIAVGLLIIIAVLVNGTTNPFTMGMGPYLAYIFIGLNEARYRILIAESRVARRREQESMTQNSLAEAR